MSQDENVVTMILLTNAMRKRWKLKTFTLDENLCMLAGERADSMASNASLFHTKGPPENIGFGFDSPEDALKGWMNSPGHRDNIVNRDHTHIGIGVSVANGVAWWCVLFVSGNR